MAKQKMGDDGLDWIADQNINTLERSLLEGAVSAQHSYQEMTGGWWLWHGPESFLQVLVAQHVTEKTDHTVYVDASIKKLHKEMERGPIRQAENSSQRPDISVWHKTTGTIRAAIEVKRAWSISGVKADAHKLETWLCQDDAPKSAYILVYSEAKGAERYKSLSTRFQNWSKKIGWRLVGSVMDPKGDETWVWGVCLLRYGP